MLRISDIHLRDFRSYERLHLEVPGKLTVLVGPNAVGKTNIVEAVQLLTSMQSFRHAKTAELLRHGSLNSRIEIKATDGNRELEIALALASESKSRHYTLNGKAKRALDLRGLVPSVAFTPDDLNLIKGSPSKRRDSLDVLGAQLNKNYHVIQKDFEKVLRHKNKLLKDGAEDMLDAINELFVRVGSQLENYRHALFARIEPEISRRYKQISGGELLQGTYIPSWADKNANNAWAAELGKNAAISGAPINSSPINSVPVSNSRINSASIDSSPIDSSPIRSVENSDGSNDERNGEHNTESNAERSTENHTSNHTSGNSCATNSENKQNNSYEHLQKAVEANTAAELSAGRTLVGPNHDRIEFTINNMDAGKFASQGQQRSAVLAWKLAEAEIIEDILGTLPILLLDDVMSELDGARRSALVDYLQRDSQTFITTANMDYFDKEALLDAHIVKLPL